MNNLNELTRIQTITFRYPKQLLLAVAKSLGRDHPPATQTEVEEYLREVVSANVASLIDEFNPPPKMTMRIKRKS